MVTSKDPLMSNVFNKGFSSSTDGEKVDANKIHVNYTVDNNGDIEIPSLGKVAVNGKSRLEAAQDIQNKLREELLKDATVTVEFVDLRFSVLGEVQAPGLYPFENDRTNVLQALGMAHDLNIYGRRDAIKVIRTEGGQQKTYVLNLLDTKQLTSSPAYYLQQNDIVYVEPNNYRKRQSSANATEITTASFWLSALSVLTTIAVLVFK
jgi:polysaccharide export outer membrane protein